jgi:hypothetical protein
MTDLNPLRGPRRVTDATEFVRLVHERRGALLSLRVPPRRRRLGRLVLLDADGETALAYIDRSRADMACLLAAILAPPDFRSPSAQTA